MDTSPFGSLSGELRNRIYAFFFATQLSAPIQIDIRPTTGARLKSCKAKTRSALALTASSRQLRQETLALFWSTASIRIVADTITSYSYPLDLDDVPEGVHPSNHAAHLNNERIHSLQRFLFFSGIYSSARFLRPIEVDLGTWDPSITATTAGSFPWPILRLVRRETAALLRPLLELQKNAGPDAATVGEITLRFGVRVKPATALGPIVVQNEREQALAAIGELCDGRMEIVNAQFREGFLTTFGQAVLANDLVMCRSVAEVLVRYIVVEGEVEGVAGSGGRVGAVARHQKR